MVTTLLTPREREIEHMRRQECHVKLDGALNRAEKLRRRGQQILIDAGNIIVEQQYENKKNMNELRVASVAVLDMAEAEKDE